MCLELLLHTLVASAKVSVVMATGRNAPARLSHQRKQGYVGVRLFLNERRKCSASIDFSIVVKAFSAPYLFFFVTFVRRILITFCKVPLSVNSACENFSRVMATDQRDSKQSGLSSKCHNL
jgi:hypothetical protein